MGKGWFFKIKLSDKASSSGLMDEAAYTDLRRKPGLTHALSPPLADRPPATCWRAIGAKSVDELFKDVPASARLPGKVCRLARPSRRARGRARLPGLRGQERLAVHGAVLHRRRRLSPSRALDRRLL